MKQLELIRVSEYTYNIDFLANHDAGDVLGEAAFIGDSGNWDAADVLEGAGPNNTCLTALRKTTCKVAEGPEACMTCVRRAWREGQVVGLRDECSDPSKSFPLDNKIAVTQTRNS